MAVVLTTERLLLREFDMQDAPFVLELCNTSTWLQYIGDRGVTSLANAINYIINGPLYSYKTYGFGLSVIVLKDTGKPVGMCGLIKRDTLEDIDIGYALLPQYEGKGYAYEIAAATVKYAVHDLKLARLVALTGLDNYRSMALLQKLGFHYEKDIQLTPDDKLLKLFTYNVS
ncbi:GNAT family N-acetyltransferase [Mucilaginibacter lacusdianchii]|uniref:GNAT family N-acetyltransferase n=1 Tax=Mucilaginibacter lacusdianchii TaxID=2684211 RepID=UPI00131BF72D|nr:GNAT family N-acetyltransferase [Mucilaginibacter sp. JXJ CY 39]